jgi:hypothetical protein
MRWPFRQYLLELQRGGAGNVAAACQGNRFQKDRHFFSEKK